MEWLWLVVGVVVLAAALGAWRWWDSRAPAASSTETPTTVRRRGRAIEGPWLGPVATIRLDVVAADPDAPSVQRLVTAATARVFRTSPDVDEVIVEDRSGHQLARVPRQAPTPRPAPTRPEAAAPPPRPHGSWTPPPVRPEVADVAVGRRPLADRLDLPAEVRARIHQPDDPVDVIRAILQSADQPVEVVGTMVRSGDDVVIVADHAGSGATSALSQAFLRFQRSGARRGVVVHLGYVDPREVARRRALAPDLHHAGPEVIQQMADAVALGGDPVEFALADVAS